ncbi:RNA polymerase sigma factor [Phenylobacterium zucineum]|uniref:RNA polymerase sigma factor n=1 Tax=Phenylobacterium zucineum TaxID=284016 RepID=UPI000674C1BA|nr:RNA polymerase sigma factor [Phenylobacterium zucineum]
MPAVSLGKALDRSHSDAAEIVTATDAGLLFRQHRSWLQSFLARRFGAELAEDLVQEAFSRCARVSGAISNPRALLATLARRAAADQFRRERAPETVGVAEPEGGYLPDQLERVLVQQLVRELPPKVREVYLLVRVVGLTYAEAAERCGISVKRVEARMTEAHKRFAALMRD